MKDLIKQIEALYDDALLIIRTWHGMGMPESDELMAWMIYSKRSPEMKRLKAKFELLQSLPESQNDEIAEFMKQPLDAAIKRKEWMCKVDESCGKESLPEPIRAKALRKKGTNKWYIWNNYYSWFEKCDIPIPLFGDTINYDYPENAEEFDIEIYVKPKT